MFSTQTRSIATSPTSYTTILLDDIPSRIPSCKNCYFRTVETSPKAVTKYHSRYSVGTSQKNAPVSTPLKFKRAETLIIKEI